MFCMDNDYVIDVMFIGGFVRYINYLCVFNCVVEVVIFERGYKIIISFNWRI